MTTRNPLVGYLAPFSDQEIAYRLGLKWWREVRHWRQGNYFPQRRLWPQLASILRCTTKDIEAAHAAYRNGDD